MDVFEAIQKRRSIRKYLPDPVPRADLERIVATAIEAPSGCNMQLREYIIVDDPRQMDRIRFAGRAMEGAPAAIVILVRPEGTKFGEFWMQDASAAMENMLLAAVAMGYGACWVEGALRPREDELREVLGVPRELRIWSLLAVGKPAETPPRPPKSAAADVVHTNRHGARS